ncbi:MAG: hypothetical protein ACI8UC_001381, partial [Psychromonas sp.]
ESLQIKGISIPFHPTDNHVGFIANAIIDSNPTNKEHGDHIFKMHKKSQSSDWLFELNSKSYIGVTI